MKKAIRMHLWMLILGLWLVAGQFIAMAIQSLLGIEGMYGGMIFMVVVFLPLCMIYPLVHKDTSVKPYPLKRLSTRDFGGTLVISVAIGMIAMFGYLLAGGSTQALEALSNYPMWAVILFPGILIATLDELFFRGVLYSDYRSRGVSIWQTAIVISVLSALVHQNSPLILVLMVFTRIIWVFMRYWTKSIWPPILSHVIINIGLNISLPRFLTYEDQTLLIIIFGIFSLVAVAVSYLSLKNMKARHDEYASPEAVIEAPQKSMGQVFNLVFWALLALLVLLQFAS